MLTFVVHMRRTAEALPRVLLLFHHRGFQIDSLAAGSGRNSLELRIEVHLEIEEDKAGFVEANLYKLVDVLLVERTPPLPPGC
jgi:acetolactate synthase small subunit